MEIGLYLSNYFGEEKNGVSGQEVTKKLKPDAN